MVHRWLIADSNQCVVEEEKYLSLDNWFLEHNVKINIFFLNGQIWKFHLTMNFSNSVFNVHSAVILPSQKALDKNRPTLNLRSQLGFGCANSAKAAPGSPFAKSGGNRVFSHKYGTIWIIKKLISNKFWIYNQSNSYLKHQTQNGRTNPLRGRSWKPWQQRPLTFANIYAKPWGSMSLFINSSLTADAFIGEYRNSSKSSSTLNRFDENGILLYPLLHVRVAGEKGTINHL